MTLMRRVDNLQENQTGKIGRINMVSNNKTRNLLRFIMIFSFISLAACGSDEVKPDKTGLQPIKLEYKKQEGTQANSGDSAESKEPAMSEDERLVRAAEINAELGIAYLRRGDVEKADLKLARAYRQNPESVAVNLGLALLNERLQYNEKAEKYFLEAVRLEGKERAAAAHNNYARFLCGQQRFDQADQFFKIAFANKLYQQREISYTNAGYCAFLAGKHDKAIDYYRQALSNNKMYAPALLNMAKLFIHKKQLPLAKAYIDRYKTVGANTPESTLIAYKVEKSLGNDAEATTLFNMLKNNHPDSKQTHEAYMLEFQNNNKTTDNKK